MFRREPAAALRIDEATRPDPRHPGISFLERSYHLVTGDGAPDIEISRGYGEAITAGQRNRPQPIGRFAGRYWWLFHDSVYSTPERLSRGAVLRLAERERPAAAGRRRRPARASRATV